MITIEHTDTFGGEANYCWVKRWHTERDLNDAQLVRLAKKLTGLTGVPCRKESFGDLTALYPRGICQVVFIAWADSDPKYQFGEPAFPEDLTPAEQVSAGLHSLQK